MSLKLALSHVQLLENGVMGRSLMILMASGLGGFGLYTEIIGIEGSLRAMKYYYEELADILVGIYVSSRERV